MVQTSLDRSAASLADRAADRLAIFETLARLAQAQDDGDFDGYRSSFTEMVLIDQPMIAGWKPTLMSSTEWAEAGLPALKGFDVTQHRLFNPVVEFDGDTATCMVDVHATHLLEEDGVMKEWVLGGRYHLKFERVGQRWLICERALRVRFQQGDLTLVNKAIERAATRNR